jgi:opacity protein-like surface antigen
MKKQTLLSVILVCFMTCANAQIKIECGPQLTSSPGYSKYAFNVNVISFGAGFMLDAKYMIRKSIGIGLTSGLDYLIPQSDWNTQLQQAGYVEDHQNYNAFIVPIRATFTYYFGEKLIKPYVGLESGVDLFISSHQYYYTGYSDHYWKTVNDNSSAFVFAPNCGLQFGIWKQAALDLNLKYNGFDLSYMSFKIGIVHILGEKQN